MPLDTRLAQLTEICLAFPNASREIMGDHAAFIVHKKKFCYFLNNHHGDGIVSVTCRALPGDNVLLAQTQPDRFYLPAYIGPKGWVALRLDIGPIDWHEVRDLVSGSYEQIAPKNLVALLKST